APVSTAREADGGGALEVERYELAVGPNVEGAPWPVRVFTTTRGAFDGAEPGAQARVQVRARGRYATAPGEWSETVVVTVADDTIPPPTPSDPVLLSAKGVVSGYWDGLSDQGTAMPPDFSHVSLAWEGTRDGVRVSGAERLYGPGSVPLPGLDRGTAVRVRFMAADRSGNESDWGDWVSVSVASVLDGSGFDEAMSLLDSDIEGIKDGTLIRDGAFIGRHLFVDEAAVRKIIAGLGEFDGVGAGWVTASMFSAGVRGRNLVPDPSFEEDYALSVWDPWGAGHGDRYQWRRSSSSAASAIVRRTADAEGHRRSGVRGLRLQTTGGGSGHEAGVISGAFPVTAGRQYRVLVHALSLDARGTLQVSVLNRARDGFDGFDSVPVTGDHTWANPPLPAIPSSISPDDYALYSYTFTPTTTGFAAVRLLNFRPVAACTLLIDDVSVVEVGIGGAAELTSAGLRLFDDLGMEAAAFVTGRPNTLTIGDPENAFAGISGAGDIFGQGLAVSREPVIMGMPLFGNHRAFQPPTDSRNILGWFDMLPWGPVQRSYRATRQTYSTSQALLEIPFMALPGRTYRVTFTGALCNFAVADRAGGFKINVKTPTYSPAGTNEAATPTYADPGEGLLYSYASAPLASSLGDCPGKSVTLRCNTGGMVVGGEINPGINKLLLSIFINSTGSIQPIEGQLIGVDVTDAGPDIPNTQVPGMGSGSQPTRSTGMTTTWRASGGSTYKGDNTRRDDSARGDLIHGYSPAAPTNGISWAHALFNAAAVSGSERGKTLTAALPAGATVQKATLRLYAKHGWFSASTAHSFSVRARTDTAAATGTGAPATSTALSATVRPGQWVSIDVTSLFTRATRSIQIGKTTSTDPVQYLRFAGANAGNLAPELTVTYSRTT
ncbi:MAG: DNRLRE domain-containing protein, partial [Propionibacteriaceae bacterium]|nr:DNRLRE domain-containing protein [Propionibacteriaceae bacterium]